MNTTPLLWIGGLTSLTVLLAFWTGTTAGAGARRTVLAADRALTGLATVAACAALALAVFAGAWQVVARFATETPSVWSEALVRTALIWMALLGLAAAIRTGALVSIDVAHRLSPPPLRRVLEALTLASALFFMGTLFWFGWTMAVRVRFQEMAGLEIPMSWGYAAIPVGAAFCMVGALGGFLDRRSEELEAAV